MDVLTFEEQKQFMDLLKPSGFEAKSEEFVSVLFKKKDKVAALMRKCDGKRSFEDIFASIWGLDEAHEMLAAPLGPYEKSEILADLLRNEGNDYFKNGNYSKALERYNVSILMSPHPEIPEVEVLLDRNSLDDYDSYTHVKLAKYMGEDEYVDYSCLAKGYANRSAVMLELQCYEKCLRDIDMALKSGYPEDLQPKLLARKERCLEALKEKDMKSFTMAILKRDPPLYNGSVYTHPPDVLQQMLYFPHKKRPVLEDPHPSIPALSSAVKVSYTPSKGRGLTANRNIRPGDILAIEEAYCVNLDQGRVSSYCNYCVTLCVDPFPCPGCGVALFCSLSCRSKALTGDHWLECKIIPTLVAMGMTSSIMAVKMLRQYSHVQLKNIYTELQDEKKLRPEEAGLNSRGIYSSNSYRPIHYLCSHKEDLRFPELFQFCQTAFVLTKLLLESERYFVDDSGIPFTPTEADLVLTGEILLSNLLRMEYNALKMTDIRQKQNQVGQGLFPALSLINHSCVPSAMQYQIGRTMVVRALRPIHAGEEITITYNMTYQDEELPSRRRTLKKYLFSCDCIACEKHWPLLVVLPEAIYRCVKCKIAVKSVNLTCQKCKVNYNSKSYRGNKKVLVDKWDQNSIKSLLALAKARDIKCKFQSFDPDAEMNLNSLWTCIETVHSLLAMPCKAFGTIERFMAQCLGSGIFYIYRRS